MKNMNANTFKLMTETLASLTYVILQNNFDLAQLKQNVYLDKLNLAAVLGVLLKRGLVSGSDVDEIMAEIKRDSEVQEELQKCRDDLKIITIYESYGRLIMDLKDFITCLSIAFNCAISIAYLAERSTKNLHIARNHELEARLSKLYKEYLDSLNQQMIVVKKLDDTLHNQKIVCDCLVQFSHNNPDKEQILKKLNEVIKL